MELDELHALTAFAADEMTGSVALGVLAGLAAPLVAPDRYLASVVLSGGLWIAAFAIFAALFVPILTAPRADRRPG